MSCIWYVSKYVTVPLSGGVGGRSFHLMREIGKMGHRAVILTSDSNHLAKTPSFNGPHTKGSIEGVDVFWIRTLKYRGSASIGRIMSWLDFEWRLWCLPKGDLPHPDTVIVSSLSLLTIFNGLWLRRRFRCRLIFEVRDIWPLTLVCEGGFSPRNPIVIGLGWIEKLAYRRADVIVGTMPNLREHVEGLLNSPPPVHCIPMGADESMILPSEALPPEYEKTHIPTCDFLVGYAGGIGIANSLETLFDCACSLQDDPRIHFLLVGEGDLKAFYKEKYSHLQNVSFAPGVPKGAVPTILQRCDLLIFTGTPSARWKFGQSLNKLIDYMLAAKPVVGSYTGYPSMLNEARSGTFVPAGDILALKSEILRLAALPPEDLAAMGARGREWILENRRFDKLARDYLTLALIQPAET